ncbi:MAG: hypothetical protein ABI847_07270 [Anaerolineales bacterium]
MTQPEDDLLRRAQAGDEQPLGEVYDQYGLALYRYVYRLLGEVDGAVDIMSETIYRWLQAQRTGRGPRHHLPAYL